MVSKEEIIYHENVSLAHHHYHPHAHHPHIQAVDGLRSLAMIHVIWFHLWIQSWLSPHFNLFGTFFALDLLPQTGAVGVELLLFITGFGLFYPYVTHKFEGTELHSLREYAYHRVIRIVPSYYLALFAGFFWFTSESGLANLQPLRHLLTHLTFTHTFFTDTNGSISVVFWTLGTEVAFYLVFPFFAWLFIRKPWLTFISMIGFGYLFRYTGLWLPGVDLTLWSRQMPGFLDVYACGMMTAYLLVWNRNRTTLPRFIPVGWRSWSRFLFLLISLTMGYLFVLTLKSINTPGSDPYARELWLTQNRLIFGVLGLLFILAIGQAPRWWQWLLTNRVMTFISIISYNWYLWHYMVILELKDRHLPSSNLNYQFDDPTWRFQFFWLALGIGLAVAILFTYLFERPLVKYGFRGYFNLILRPFWKLRKSAPLQLVLAE